MRGKQNSLFPKGPVIKWKNNHVIDKMRATAANISQVIVNCFPFDVTVFAMLPTHGIWQPRSQGLSSLPPLVIGRKGPMTKGGREERPWERGWAFGGKQFHC